MRPILLLFFIFFNPKLFFLFCSSFTFFPNGKKKKSLRERERGGKTEKVLKFERFFLIWTSKIYEIGERER